MPGSRRRIEENKRFPIWIPIAALLAAAGILFCVSRWPVPADEAYELKLNTPELLLTIEEDIPGAQKLDWSLEAKTALLRARAAASLRETALTWTSLDPTVARVDADGTVTAVEEGRTVITGQFGSLSVSCPVVVYYPLKGLRFSVTRLSLEKTQTASLSVRPVPAKAELPSPLSFESSDPAVVTVDAKGNLQALTVGTAEIRVRGGAFEAVCPVSVLSPMTGIRIGTAPSEMNVGELFPLEMLFLPADTTDDRTVRWESLDPAVLFVDENGLASALAPGTAGARGEAGGFLAEVSFPVFAPLKGILAEPDSLTLLKDETALLEISFDPENTTDDTAVLFSSSDPETVRVDADGRVTAVRGGDALITAQAGEHTAVCAVRVRVPMTGLVIDGKNRTLARGETAALSVSFSPFDTNDDQTLLWLSEDETVAQVDENGLVSAVGPGETLITASCGEFSDKVRITVTVPAEAVTISRESLNLSKGESETLSAAVLPEDTTEGQWIVWRSSDSSVVQVDEAGNLKAVGGGECTVTASHGELSAVCRIYVKAPLTGIGLNTADTTLIAGDSTRLSVIYYPGDTTDDRSVSWSSSDSTVATVDGNGNVVSHEPGTCTVTASCGGFSASATVRVRPLIRVSSVSLSRGSLAFTGKGQTASLSAAVSPENATYPSVRWSSSDQSVATVGGDGTVRAVGSGSCVITATADGVSASCQVTVSSDKIVILDPGHGGRWPGCTAVDGSFEKDLTLATAYACKWYLETYYTGVQVYMTRYGDDVLNSSNVDADLQARANFASQKGADLMVCLHYNADGSGGAMVFASVDASIRTASYDLGTAILNQIVKLRFRDRGVIQKQNDNGNTDDYYGILRYCAWQNIPSVLVEHCFIDLASDYAMLDTDQMGTADAIGIANYLGLKRK